MCVCVCGGGGGGCVLKGRCGRCVFVIVPAGIHIAKKMLLFPGNSEISYNSLTSKATTA